MFLAHVVFASRVDLTRALWTRSPGGPGVFPSATPEPRMLSPAIRPRPPAPNQASLPATRSAPASLKPVGSSSASAPRQRANVGLIFALEETVAGPVGSGTFSGSPRMHFLACT